MNIGLVLRPEYKPPSPEGPRVARNRQRWILNTDQGEKKGNLTGKLSFPTLITSALAPALLLFHRQADI